ncbi:hypothetical protein ACFVH6_10440 [Spirillospora sp. NPDC127200]
MSIDVGPAPAARKARDFPLYRTAAGSVRASQKHIDRSGRTAAGEPARPDLDASRSSTTSYDRAQRVLRPLNGLAACERDLALGGLVAQTPSPDADKVGITARLAETVERCQEPPRPPASARPGAVAHPERQIGCGAGLSGSGDYRGAL